MYWGKKLHGAVNFRIGAAMGCFDTSGTVHTSVPYDNCKLMQTHGPVLLDSCENTGLAGSAA